MTDNSQRHAKGDSAADGGANQTHMFTDKIPQIRASFSE
jgi:hypothetical protein